MIEVVCKSWRDDAKQVEAYALGRKIPRRAVEVSCGHKVMTGLQMLEESMGALQAIYYMLDEEGMLDEAEIVQKAMCEMMKTNDIEGYKSIRCKEDAL